MGLFWGCGKRIRTAVIFHDSGLCETAFNLENILQTYKNPYCLTKTKTLVRRKEQTNLITLVIITPKLSFASIFSFFFSFFLIFFVFPLISPFLDAQSRYWSQESGWRWDKILRKEDFQRGKIWLTVLGNFYSADFAGSCSPDLSLTGATQ